jgi:sugar/nucleoside kinase (ribokinase family)
MAGPSCGRVVSLGAHIVDILGRPVTEIPPGQGRLLLDEIRITAAGTAAGTSVDLVKLGAEAIAMGAVGDDMLADLLISLMAGYGVDTRLLARKPGQRTSATILPIRPNGERPALHMPGATSSLSLDDIDLDTIASADVLHVGAPDVLGRFGGEPLVTVLRLAREHGLIVTVDVLSRGDATTWDRLKPALRYVRYFMPNEDQLAGLTGTKDLDEAARMALDLGPEAVLVSRGADGAALITPARRLDVPALSVQVVDTTGCGDAVNAGFIIGLLHGWPIEDASWLAMAAASLVAGGLGSDAGIVDYASTIDVLRPVAPRAVLDRIGPA